MKRTALAISGLALPLLVAAPISMVQAIEIDVLQYSHSTNWLNVGLTLLLLTLLPATVYLLYSHIRNRHTQLRFNMLWRQLPDRMAEVNDRGVILAVNRPFNEALQESEMVGSPLVKFLPDKDATLFNEHLNLAFTTGIPRQYELESRIDERSAYLQVHILPMKVLSEVKSCLAIISDITAHREAEQTLENAREQAEASAQSKSTFLANMSHELRTPLSGIVGMVSLLDDSYNSEDMRQYTEPLLSSVEHLRRIVDDILDFAKVDGGNIVLEETDTNLWQILDDLESLYESQALQKGVALKVKSSRDVPRHIQIDAFRLRQILYNLLGNALKFTEDGSVLLEVSLQTLIDKPMLRFSVVDTGIGISNDQQENIFDAFKQANISTTRNYGGTGLGLAICKKLAELMGGVIGVNSTEGVGSEFWFTVPMTVTGETENWAFWQKAGVTLKLENPHQEQWFNHFFGSLNIPIKNDGELLVTDHADPSAFKWLWWLGSEQSLKRSNAIVLKPPFRRGALCNRLLDYQQRQRPSSPDIQLETTESHAILLVEDNPTNQVVVRRMMEKMGYQVSVADNGKEGVHMWSTGNFAVIIMDVQMPVMDGIDATRMIRQKEVHYTPIIALTANAQDEVEESCFAAGVDAFITKPVDRQQLQNTIEAVMGGHRMNVSHAG